MAFCAEKLPGELIPPHIGPLKLRKTFSCYFNIMILVGVIRLQWFNDA